MNRNDCVWRFAPLIVLCAAAALSNACGDTSGPIVDSPLGSNGSGPGYSVDSGISGFVFLDSGQSPPPPPNLRSLAQRPSFAPTVTASVPPPPVSGGTLIVTRDGKTAVASDPDRDAVYVVDVAGRTVSSTVQLQSGDEPGRLVEDGAGRVHVALRRGGALVTLDPKQGTVLARRDVCPAPRGLAWDASTDLVWVACATGELAAFPSAGGAAKYSSVLERDLRDVIIQKGSIAVTKFRSAEVLRLASDGTVARRDALPATNTPAFGKVIPPGSAPNDASASPGFTPSGTDASVPPPPPPLPPGFPNRSLAPHVAWRAIAAPSGEILIVHQGESETPIMTKTPGAYGASGPVVESEMTIVSSDGTTTTQTLSMTVLPVDVALSPDGTYGAVVSAGTAFTTLAQVSYFDFNSNLGRPPAAAPVLDNAQPIAVAFDGTGDVLVQSREPADLWVIPVVGTPTPISLSTASRDDTGHDVFHAQAGGLLACASCHPEGGDDGHLWLLDGAPRRTPSLRGTIAGTAPYHWPGDEANLVVLADDVYSGRMSGAKLTADQTSALTAWVEAIPPPPAPSWVDAAAASRGRALFEGTAGCASCHSGPKYTNNATVFVGTGGKTLSTGGSDGILFQVPPLVGVGWRTPLLHDGCATTIADRFGKCATPKHGSTQQLSTQDVDNLSAYLESL